MNLKVSDERATKLRRLSAIAGERMWSHDREQARVECADATDDLLDDLAALRAEVERLRDDAERWRFVRSMKC